MNGLQLLMQVQKIRIFSNVCSSILNMMLLNQEQGEDMQMFNTWDS